MAQQLEGTETSSSSMNSRLNVLMAAMNKLTINLTSIGCDDQAHFPSKVMINGKNYIERKRGVHIIDIDIKSLAQKLYGGDAVLCVDEVDLKQYMNCATFDTYGKKEAGPQFMNHLQGIKNANIVIIVVYDSVDVYWPKEAFNYFQYNLKMNSLRLLKSIGFRESFALIGRSGILEDYSSAIKRTQGYGPAQISVVIPIKKDS